MNDESPEQLEQRLLSMQMPIAPQQLRPLVLSELHSELRAARWERRLAQAAAALLVLGIALNVDLRPHRSANPGRANNPSHESLAQVAIAVAETTDAQTGRQFARRLAALAGWSLDGEEAAAIDAAVTRKSSREHLNGKDG